MSFSDNKPLAKGKLSVNKCFLAKSPVGSLPFVHREFPIVGKFPCERGLYRARRSGGEPSSRDLILVHEFLLLRKINSVSRFAVNLFLRKIFAARGEQVLSCFSGLPQKSRGEFCGKRSGRRIRSCGKRSAPQTKTPCRDEVRRGGALTTCELGNAPLLGA